MVITQLILHAVLNMIPQEIKYLTPKDIVVIVPLGMFLVFLIHN